MSEAGMTKLELSKIWLYPCFSASNEYGLFEERKNITQYNSDIKSEPSTLNSCWEIYSESEGIVNKYTGKKEKTRYKLSTLQDCCGICYKKIHYSK